MKVVRTRTRTGTQSVERAFAVLKLVGAASTNGVTFPAIVKAVCLNRTTTYRMLKCLIQEGAVRFDVETAKYFLGPLALELGLSARHQVQFKVLLAGTLTRIAEATGDTVFLLLRRGNDSVCVDRRLGAYPVKTLVVDVGTQRPLGVGAAGIAILQAMPDDEAQEVIRKNADRFPLFDTTADSVFKAVRAARSAGYVSTRVHGVEGVTAIALPITDPEGQAVAALAVAAVAKRMSRARQAELVRIVRSEIRQAEFLLSDGNVEAAEG